MPSKTSRKTTRNMTKNTGKTKTAAIGSDDYMVGHGFHPSSAKESAAYGKFTKCATAPASASAVRTAGSMLQLVHQAPDQSRTRQSEATLTFVLSPKSECSKSVNPVAF